jgi:hypothetical protein
MLGARTALANDDQSQGRSPPRFRKVAARSFASPLNLSVAGAAAATAVALHSWPLVALGGAAYAALVAWDLVSPDFWRKSLQNPAGTTRVAPGKSLDPKKVKDPGLRQTAARIVAARAELDRLVSEASGDVAVQLAGVSVAIDELEDRAASLITVGDQLIAYLGRSDLDGVRREIEALRSRAQWTTDAEAKDQYGRTVKAREEQLLALTDIASAVERVYANLSRIVATVEGLSTKVVRMGAMDAQAMDNLSGDMNAELERMNLEITTFEETLKHLVATEANA